MKVILIPSYFLDTLDKLRIVEDISPAWDDNRKSGEKKDPLLQEQKVQDNSLSNQRAPVVDKNTLW